MITGILIKIFIDKLLLYKRPLEVPLPYLPSESEKPILSTEYNNYEENTDMPNFEKILNNHLLEALVESGSGKG